VADLAGDFGLISVSQRRDVGDRNLDARLPGVVRARNAQVNDLAGVQPLDASQDARRLIPRIGRQPRPAVGEGGGGEVEGWGRGKVQVGGIHTVDGRRRGDIHR